jgi:outer membrane receptor for ferric coprogen and ferric-rhodotorulic acid
VAVHEDGDSYLDRYHGRKNVLYGVVDAELGQASLLSLGYGYQKTKPTGVTWGSFPLLRDDGSRIRWPRGFTSAADWTWWNNTTQTAFADLKHEFANGWQLQAQASHRRTDADSALFYVYGFPNAVTGKGIIPYAYKSYQHGRQNMLDVQATGPFQAFGREQALVLGVNGSSYGSNYYQFPHGALPEVGDFNHWTGAYPYPDFARDAQFVSHSRLRQQGIYAAVRLQLTDPLKLVAGMRHARWRNDTNDATSGSYHETQSSNLPYAGLIYDLSAHYSAFASYTRIFDPQTKRTANGSYLEPMLGSSREIGIKGSHMDGALNTSLTLFETRLDHVAEADVGKTLPDGITQAYYGVNGTTSRGYELEVSGSFNPDWNGSFGWSHFNVKAPRGGAIRTALPRTLLRSFTSVRLPGAWHHLTVGGSLDWQGPSHTPVDGPTGPQRVDQSSVLLVGVMARYALGERASLQVNGNNLLNRKYLVLDDFSNPYYAPPAQYMVSFNYRFR